MIAIEILTSPGQVWLPSNFEYEAESSYRPSSKLSELVFLLGIGPSSPGAGNVDPSIDS